MKILLISAGLAPKRDGGVPLYVADLRDALISRGHEVIYLDSNCQDDSNKPRITQRATSPCEYSYFNSGSRLPWGVMPEPLSDVRASLESRACFFDFVHALKPDVIHFQETICFPLDLISELKACGFIVILTAQDYSSLCPTIKLFKDDKSLCQLKAHELQCHHCVRRSSSGRPPRSGDWTNPLIPGSNFASRIARAILRCLGAPANPFIQRRFSRASYITRRLEAVTHLKAFSTIICNSKLELSLIASSLDDDSANLRQVYLSQSSIATQREISPAIRTSSDGVIRFVALNMSHEAKGRNLLLQEFARLREDLKNVELHLFGNDHENNSASGVVHHGPYQRSDLDSLLSLMDVGIIPSLWPETYGFVGPEMLTRGIPLIVSTAGAMPEYVIPNVNGLHFDPSKPGDLKAAMHSVATNPDLLHKLKSNATGSKQGIVSFPDHIAQMESIYEEAHRLAS